MSGVSRKRSRSPAEDAYSTFVTSMASKVTGLLPATITKWFSSSSQSNTNGSAPTAEVTDSSSDEEPEISPITQPPLKRTRYNTLNHYNASETNCGTYTNELPESSSYNAGQLPLKKFARDSSIISTPLRPPNEETSVDRSERDSTRVESNFSFSHSTLGPPVLKKRKSLFKTSTSNDESPSAKPSHNTMVDPKQPCFIPSLLVSPFYPSRTTYGGASSQYINRPNITQRKGTYVNELVSNENTSMSHSARRIMDLLQDYSSPIMEAKRIPQYSLSRKDPIASSSQQSNNKSMSYKTTEFHAPNIASILKLKQKSRLMNTTNAARQIIASHSSACHFAPYSLSPNRRSQSDVESRSKGVGTTTETPLTEISQQKNEHDFDTPPTLPPVSLPTAVLQINKDNLPKFTFDNKFAAPGAPPKPTLSSKVEKTLPKVSDSPITTVEPVAKIPISTSETSETNSMVMNKPDDDKCVSCGGKKPSSEGDNIAKCSVCKLANSQLHIDKCINCEKIPINSGFNSTPLVNSVKSTKWKCNDCWVENDEDKEKCVCCGSKNPKMSLQSTPAAPAKAAAASDWTCDDCWIKNTSSVDKCAACGGAKPGSKQSAAPVLPTSVASSTLFKKLDNKSFKPLVASQKDKWECTSCLVRNDNDKEKCVCCEMERPGGEKKTVKTTFNFGIATNTFKFGIDPKVQEANLAKPPEIKPIEKKAEESETNNNVLSKAPPAFSFGIPAKKSEDQTDNTKNKIPAFTPVTTADSTIPVQQTVKMTLPSFTFEKTETKNDEKPQEVPKVDFSLPTQASSPVSKPFGGIHGVSSSIPTPSISVQSPPPCATLSLVSPATSLEKQDSNSTQLSFQLGTATTSAPSPTQSKFTFSGSGLKPATNLFAKPASSLPTTSISFTPPAQSSATTTISALFQKSLDSSTPALSLFSKNETSTNSQLSLFQKPIPATTAAAPSNASSAPVFSFGTSPKPASNFSFGTTQPANMNESTANNSFKFFGSAADKNTSANKFSLGGTSHGTGNSLGSGNTLGGGNGLSAGNVLGTSLSGANSITSGNAEMTAQKNNNDLQPGSSITSPTSNIFGAPAQKENIWSQSSSPSSNLFGTNNAANSLQNPRAFTFGATSTGFGSQSSNPAGPSAGFAAAQSNVAASGTTFGAPQNNPVATGTAFGSQLNNAGATSTPFNAQPSNPAPVFGNNAQTTQNLYGVGNQNPNATRTLFPNVQNQPSPNVFDSSLLSSVDPTMEMTGSPTDPTSHALPTAPTFNFGVQVARTPVVFGFGQQPQGVHQQQQIYNFNAAKSAPHMGMGSGNQVQFNIGSAPVMRRVRKAVRRNPQR